MQVQVTIKVYKKHWLLANCDTESIDFKLAGLSAMNFVGFRHTKLFELKAVKWAKSYRRI